MDYCFVIVVDSIFLPSMVNEEMDSLNAIIPNPQIPIGIVWKRVGCVLGIEPNEHQIPRFQGKYRSKIEK